MLFVPEHLGKKPNHGTVYFVIKIPRRNSTIVKILDRKNCARACFHVL